MMEAAPPLSADERRRVLRDNAIGVYKLPVA